MPESRVLIAYITTDGQTERIARRMAEEIRGRGYPVDVLPLQKLPKNVLLRGYGAMLMGGSVQYGHHPRELLDFVRHHRLDLERVPSGFFSVSMSVARPEGEEQAKSQRYVDDFLAATGWRPSQVARFAGAVRYTQYGSLKRFMMKLVNRPLGATDTSRDYEFTDWSAVSRFVDEVLDRLALARPLPPTPRPEAPSPEPLAPT